MPICKETGTSCLVREASTQRRDHCKSRNLNFFVYCLTSHPPLYFFCEWLLFLPSLSGFGRNRGNIIAACSCSSSSSLFPIPFSTSESKGLHAPFRPFKELLTRGWPQRGGNQKCRRGAVLKVLFFYTENCQRSLGGTRTKLAGSGSQRGPQASPARGPEQGQEHLPDIAWILQV